MKKLILLLSSLLFLSSPKAQNIDPDDTQAAKEWLDQQRALTDVSASPAFVLKELIRLGLWKEAEKEVMGKNLPTYKSIAKARLLYLKNRYFEAEEELKKLKKHKNLTESISGEIQLLEIQLLISAWKLKEAEQSCISILKKSPKNVQTVLQLAKVYTLQKNFPKAIALAQQVQEWDAENAQAFLLEAEALLWQRKQEEAERALRKCLALDPLNADARFYYGYAIWRRVDATQLPDMAAQWALSLEINPLHYLTHWHWGNGHTQLSYADYAQEEDDEVRKELKVANLALGENDTKSALEISGKIARKFPQSVLADMFRASTYYQIQNSDSAEAIFLRILQKKKNYGPAHNGLAAVIKQRRFPYLQYSDSLQKEIKQTRIEDEEEFYNVFPDLAFYPGDRVAKMVYKQLYTGVAYLPFLQKLNRKFVIPPLHTDLAEAMKNPYFRGGTTFDNRQWMDIRGVGSGATGIEYVERGAHLERNVTLHEYVHLFHGRVFTDAELREVRKRYYYAMEHDCTLDYYGANNEFEYLAQAFPAYFIPIKVHPLNHKSMNTRSDLEKKDPLMFEFVDKLVKKQQAFIKGNQKAMADNWAHIYTELGKQALWRNQGAQALAYLQTAKSWDSSYVPIYLAQAQLYQKNQDFDSALYFLELAQEINPTYAPIYQSLAGWEWERFELGITEELASVKAIKEYYERAETLEKDLGLRPALNTEIRNFYRSFGRIAEAIEATESYIADAPEISTYLRDSKDRAEAFVFEQKGLLGYAKESLAFFEKLLAKKPQDYGHRLQYARILRENGKWDQALEVLEEGNRILSASGNANPNYLAAMSRIFLQQADTLKALEAVELMLAGKLRRPSNSYSWIGLLADLGKIEEAEQKFQALEVPRIPFEQSQYLYTAAKLELLGGNKGLAQLSLQEAVKHNIYNFQARFLLLSLLDKDKEPYLIKKIAKQGMLLPVPPAGFVRERLAEYMGEE
ncbi:MAG: tetratricopeptide repeat protein [Bacteroidota bacterium]